MKMLSSDFCDEIYYRSYEMAQHHQRARLKEPTYYIQYGDTNRMQKFTVAIHEQVGLQNLYSVEKEKTVAADGFATGMQYACVAMETK
ncbi:hypothetical protein FIU89_09780 [Roseovarius sp. THAF27]|nr:hypothetical protein FIU89_09780 [Roseovarius sp. THAF27]